MYSENNILWRIYSSLVSRSLFSFKIFTFEEITLCSNKLIIGYFTNNNSF